LNLIDNSLILQLLFIRKIEEEIGKKYPTGIFRCPVHLAIGQEAVSVGVCSHLSTSDIVLASHRSHHHYLAKGGDPLAMICELAGLENGCSKGHGGSTHLIDESVGFAGSTAIIGGVLPVASGIAHSMKLNAQKNIVVVFVGDAVVEEGVFFETLNMAALLKLPLLIVIEDNDLSCYTSKSQRQSYKSYQKIAELFGLFYLKADGSDLNEVIAKSSEVVQYIRGKNGPAILHAEVFRALEHCGPESDDHLAYRSLGDQWPQMDPIYKLQSHYKTQLERLDVEAENKKNALFEKLAELIKEAND
jgi:TPP-dependent pyruvate/acetoin dehydrogenase alpha subunit